MTDQKPDRQDDGLLPPLRRLRNIACNGKVWDIIDAIDIEIGRATRDGAEGAKPECAPMRAEFDLDADGFQTNWRLAPASLPAVAAEPWPPYIKLPLTFWYKNHRGEESLRTAFPISIRFGTTEWHPEAQWLLKAFDRDKQAEREFAMRDMLASPPVRGDRETLEAIRQEVVLAIGFLTRDGNTDRITETVRQLIPRLACADEKLRAILSLPVQTGAARAQPEKR